MSVSRHRFTLLELLVAGIMVVLILGAVLGSYRAATDSVEQGRARLTAQQEARAVLHRVVRDLRGAHKPKPALPPEESGKVVLSAAARQEAFEDQRQPHFTGGTRARGRTSIDMVTTAGIPAPGQPTVGLCRVAYRFSPSTGLLERGQAMYLGSLPDQEATVNWVAISYNVVELDFDFLESEDRWVGGWNSNDEDDNLPAAVRVTLTMSSGDGAPITYSTIARVGHFRDNEEETSKP